MSILRRGSRAKPYPVESWRDITPMNVSMGTMAHHRTGTWRFLRPVYEDKTPACQNACPAGCDMEGWIALLERRDAAAAFWHLKQEQPFPAVLGRVCFAFCEKACNRAPLDGRVDIRDLERFVGDRFDPVPAHPRLPEKNTRALAVVGSGPAGMAAAYFAALLGYTVTVFESREKMGGLLREGIPPYRLPKAVVDRELEALAALESLEKFCASVDVRPDGLFASGTLEKTFGDHFLCRRGVEEIYQLALKDEPKKDIEKILLGHHIPYLATVSIAYPDDMVAKFRKMRTLQGIRFVHLLAPCPPGWRIDASQTVRIARMATRSHVFSLYEVQDGVYRINVVPESPIAVTEYLKAQGRFKEMTDAMIQKIQTLVERNWTELCAKARPWRPSGCTRP